MKRYKRDLCISSNDNEIMVKAEILWSEDDVEREKRSRNTTYFCQDYCAQAEDFYTYNDFLYWLNKAKG